MIEQINPGILLLIIVTGYGVAFWLGFDTGAKGQTRKTRKTLQRFEEMITQVKQWRSSPEATQYTRGYSEGYTDCLHNIEAFLERHVEHEPS